MRTLALCFATLAFCFAASAGEPAGDRLVRIDTRPGVHVAYWFMPRPGAKATLLLFPGGEGSIGFHDGTPHSKNFLVRSRDLFAAAGFDVAILGKPSDHDDMDLAFRASPEHVTDVTRVVESLRATGHPVWLVGTSRGTTSVAAAAIALGPAIAGVVMTSSIANPALPQAVENLPIARIGVPVLVMSHRLDACKDTSPEDAPRILAGLTGTSVKKLLIVSGGGAAYGPVCEPMHWHGFVGMEQEAVDAITAFIRDPRPGPS